MWSRPDAESLNLRRSFSRFSVQFELLTFRRKKIVLVWICLISVTVFFVSLLLFFYVTPIHDCEICKYFNCIPITKDFCADQDVDLHTDI